MSLPVRSEIRPGLTVQIVEKQNQRNGVVTATYSHLAHSPAVHGNQDRRAGDHRGREGVLQLPGSRVDPIAADPSR